MAYEINIEPLVGTLEKLDVQRVIDETTESWVNHTLCRVDEVLVRLGVLHGEFHWHKHDDEDEFFLVLEGELEIEVEGHETIVLLPSQGVTIPKGVVHRPRAAKRTVMIMVEPGTIAPTGD